MNTSKQVNVMVGLLMVFVVATLLYFLWDTDRAKEAEGRQLTVNAERGGKLHGLNCSSCHGLTGKGAVERPGLPGAVLNDPSKRPASIGELTALQARYRDTIKCGRNGTLMPPWSTEQNGALNDFQIEQLVILITSAESEAGWEFAMEEANHLAEFKPAKRLTAAAAEEDTTLIVSSTAGIKEKDLLRIDDDPTDEVYELVTVTRVIEAGDEIRVERGAAGSLAADHRIGAHVLLGPILPPTGPLTGESPSPPCGQKQVQPAATPAPGGANGGGSQVSGSISLDMGDNFFQLDGQKNPTLNVKAGETIDVTLKNTGTAIHNMRTGGDDGKYNSSDDAVSDPQLVSAGQEAKLSFKFTKAGTYNYQCDFHPTDMKGQIVVTE